MSEKDYSLLRTFDLEAAKRGEAICYDHCGESRIKYLAGPDAKEHIAYEAPDGLLYASRSSNFRMAPLAWVEGKPVYPGDVLYCPNLHEKYSKHAVSHVENDRIYGADGLWVTAGHLTWTAPKVKREGWVNVYRQKGSLSTVASISDAHETEQDANDAQRKERIACIRIEWDEPA
jgi:hypothetical protein